VVKKLFIAVNLPKILKEKISNTFYSNLENFGIKTTYSNNLHITLKFLGYLDEKNVKRVKVALGKIIFEPFELKICGAGEFNGKVIWIDVQDKKKQLEKINFELNNILELQKDRFHAHITIARNKHQSLSKVKKIIEGLNKLDFSKKILVKSIELVESVPGRTHNVYEKVFQENAH